MVKDFPKPIAHLRNCGNLRNWLELAKEAVSMGGDGAEAIIHAVGYYPFVRYVTVDSGGDLVVYSGKTERLTAMWRMIEDAKREGGTALQAVYDARFDPMSCVLTRAWWGWRSGAYRLKEEWAYIRQVTYLAWCGDVNIGLTLKLMRRKKTNVHGFSISRAAIFGRLRRYRWVGSGVEDLGESEDYRIAVINHKIVCDLEVPSIYTVERVLLLATLLARITVRTGVKTLARRYAGEAISTILDSIGASPPTSRQGSREEQRGESQHR